MESHENRWINSGADRASRTRVSLPLNAANDVRDFRTSMSGRVLNSVKQIL